MWYCPKRRLAMLMLCTGAGIIAGTFLSFGKALIIGLILIFAGLYLKAD